MVRVRYLGVWQEWDVPVPMERGGQLTGLAAQLVSVALDVAWVGDVDVRRLEGAAAEVEGIACRVRGAAVEGHRVTATLEPVDGEEGGYVADVGVDQQRWPVQQTLELLTMPPYYQRVRTGPPEESVGVAYPVVVGAPGAWVGEDGEQITGEGTPVVVIDTDPVTVTRSVIVATADGTSAYVTTVLTLPHQPVSAWPITLTTRIGGSVVVGYIDGSDDPVFSGSLIAGTWDAETGTLSATWDGVPDASADITAAWSAATWRGVTADGLVTAETVSVAGVLCTIRSAVDGVGQSLPVVWLGGAGSTDVPVWDGSALTCSWVAGGARDGRLGQIVRWLAQRSTLAFDTSACAALDFLRVDLAWVERTACLDALVALAEWAPMLLLEGVDGLQVLPMVGQAVPVDVTGRAVSSLSAVVDMPSVQRVRVVWAGGVVEKDVCPSATGVKEVTVPTAHRATAEWVARWWASWLTGTVTQVDVTTDHALAIGRSVRWQGRDGIVIGSLTSAAGAVAWRLWLR